MSLFLEEEPSKRLLHKNQKNTNGLSQRFTKAIAVWSEHYRRSNGLFIEHSTKRSLKGKRNDLKLVVRQAEQFFDEASRSPFLVMFEILSSDNEVRVSAADIISSDTDTKFGEPLFAIRADHFLFTKRRIQYAQEVTPFCIQFHALKRIAERADLEGIHVFSLLHLFRQIVTESAPVAILMNHAVSSGLVPSWMRLPIPLQDGVLLCNFVNTRTTRGFQERRFFISKHGLTIPPIGPRSAQVFIQANTFLTYDMLKKNQQALVEDLANSIDRIIEDVINLGPTIYGRNLRDLSAREEDRIHSLAASMCRNINPKNLNTAF